MDFYRRSCDEIAAPDRGGPPERERIGRALVQEQIPCQTRAFRAEQRRAARPALRETARSITSAHLTLGPETKEISECRPPPGFEQHPNRLRCAESQGPSAALARHSLVAFKWAWIFFWVDESPVRRAVGVCSSLAARSVPSLIQVSALPLMRPVRKTALQLVEIVRKAEL